MVHAGVQGLPRAVSMDDNSWNCETLDANDKIEYNYVSDIEHNMYGTL